MSEEKKTVVCIDELAWARMQAYCRASKPNEVIGMAHCKMMDGNIVVHDPFIIKQQVASATCEFDSKEFAKFLSTHDRIKDVLCVWHSHVEMSAFFSTCDRGTSEALANLGRMMRQGSSWFVSIVMNVKGEYQCKVDISSPVKMEINAELQQVASSEWPVLADPTEEDIKSLLEDKEVQEYLKSRLKKRSTGAFLADITSKIEKEVKEKCSSSYTSSWPSGGSSRGSQGSFDDDFGSESGYRGWRSSYNGNGHQRVVSLKSYSVDDLVKEILDDIGAPVADATKQEPKKDEPKKEEAAKTEDLGGEVG